MYADPQYIRSHEIKLRFNDHEAALIEALVGYTGQQRAVLLRELVMEGLQVQQQTTLKQPAATAGRP